MLEHGARSGARGDGHTGADGSVVVRRDQDAGHLLCQYYVPCLRTRTPTTEVKLSLFARTSSEIFI